MKNQKRVLVLGAAGFIGNDLVRKLKDEDLWVRAADRHPPLYSQSLADEFLLGDLCDQSFVRRVVDSPFDIVFQMAAVMGGANYFYSQLHDADIYYNAFNINANVLRCCVEQKVGKVFFPSSSYVYPAKTGRLYTETGYPEEADAPADPETAYGWSKLAVERLYQAYHRNYGLEIRIARLTNVFGPEQPFQGLKGKVPGIFFAKILHHETISLSGDGQQLRSFLFISDCIEGICRLMEAPANYPVNIGASQVVSMNQLLTMITEIVGEQVPIRHDLSPQESNSRRVDNQRMKRLLQWSPEVTLRDGLRLTWEWVAGQIEKR